MKKVLLLGLYLFVAFSINAQNPEPKKSSNLKRGAYINFNEFVSNNPSITDSFYIETVERSSRSWEGTYNLIPRYSETNKKIKKIWGFCDGTKAYIFHETEFFLIEIEEDQYWFVGYGRIDNSGAVTAGVLGGAIGGAIGGAVAQAQARNKKVKYVYDILNGVEISPYLKLPKTWNLLGTNLNFYRRDKKQLEQAVDFVINDSLYFSFPPNSFKSLFFELGSRPVKICYGEDNSNCFFVGIIGNETKYIECSMSEKDSVPKLTEVETADGEYYSMKPEKIQQKLDQLGIEMVANLKSSENLSLPGSNLIFYRRDKKQLYEEVVFAVNDSLTFSFLPNSYESLFIEFGGSPVKVCYGEDLSKCFEVELHEGETKYIECSLPYKNPVPKLTEVSKTDGEYYSSEPKMFQEN